jgi:hypothetical protein
MYGALRRFTISQTCRYAYTYGDGLAKGHAIQSSRHMTRLNCARMNPGTRRTISRPSHFSAAERPPAIGRTSLEDSYVD